MPYIVCIISEKQINMRAIRQCLILLFLLLHVTAWGQLSPPGLGKTNTGSWLAFGIKNPYNAADTDYATTYIAVGRLNPVDEPLNAIGKQGVIVLNHEIYHQPTSHWKYSYALSYRNQEVYNADSYDPDAAETQQEIRLYARSSLITALPHGKLTNTLRQEFRKYFDEDFHHVHTDYQFRTRLKSQLTENLSASGRHKLILSAEVLFSLSKYHDVDMDWSTFAYKESRFGLYYSYKPKHSIAKIDIGYMNNLSGVGDSSYDASYISMDVILENPFRIKG